MLAKSFPLFASRLSAEDRQMNIIVAVEQVPSRDSAVHVDSSGKWLDEENLGFATDDPGAYALAAALTLKVKHDGAVVVRCAGPQGADRAILVESDDLVQFDTVGWARLLPSAVAWEKPAPIFNRPAIRRLRNEAIGAPGRGRPV